jgi:HEAT repeat protein
MNRQRILGILVAISTAIAVLIGCRADPDDAAGQAGELSDPVRRENAIANIQRLYSEALSAADSDRTKMTVTGADGRERPGPKKIADDTVEALARTYRDNPTDSQNGARILELLRDMQDVRALPAFTKALEWRSEVSEEHAITAARAIETLEIPEGQKEAVVNAISTALDRVQGTRGVDNRMRIHFIRTLGALNDRRATPILTKIATRTAEDQNFQINILAAEELGNLGDPAAVDPMIRALYLFAPNNPLMRMNDVAAQALVGIGRPSLDPLIATLRGENDQVRRIVEAYITAVRQRNAEAAASMNVQTIIAGEACYALGQLGFREAIDPMMSQIEPLTALPEARASAQQVDDIEVYPRALGCLVALIQIHRNEADTERVRNALVQTYARTPKAWPPVAPGSSRMQLLAASMHTYDGGILDFLHTIARTPEDEIPDTRVLAVRSYAFLANRAEAERINAVITAEPGPEEGGFRTNFEENRPALAAAQECDADVQCWIGKLGDENPIVVRKATYMLGRYARGNDAAVTALVAQMDHANQEVRGDVLYAIDWIADNGSAAAIAEIDRIADEEEGRSSWNQIKSLALSVRARLATRSGG